MSDTYSDNVHFRTIMMQFLHWKRVTTCCFLYNKYSNDRFRGERCRFIKVILCSVVPGYTCSQGTIWFAFPFIEDHNWVAIRRRESSDVNLILKNNSSEANLLTASTKTICDILILNKYVRPTALGRWQVIYCIDENDWSDIFKLCYFCTRETKLQSLQFKIVH